MDLLESTLIRCPYCGEEIELLIDRSVPEQQYIEDCPVCCRPMEVLVAIDPDTPSRPSVRRDDEV